jgi:hypothetical protein
MLSRWALAIQGLARAHWWSCGRGRVDDVLRQCKRAAAGTKSPLPQHSSEVGLADHPPFRAAP